MSKPVKYTPRAFQQKAFEFAIRRKRFALFLDMGLGKTAVTLSWAEYLICRELAVDKVLVIAPKLVVQNTWPSEVAKWEHTSTLKVSVIVGDKKQRMAALVKKADVYLINREMVSWLIDEVYKGRKCPFDAIIIDESSSFKNRRSNRWKSLKKWAFKVPRMVLLTGTPAPNGYLDLWAQMYFVDGGKRLGTTFDAYKEKYFEVDLNTIYSGYPKFVLREGAEQEIKDAIKDVAIYMSAEDHADLPPVTYNTIRIPLSPQERAKYQAFERDRVMELIETGEELTASSASALSNKLLQFANGAVYYEEVDGDKIMKRWEEVSKAKLSALVDFVDEQQGQPILLAYTFKHDKERIIRALKGRKVRELKDKSDENDWNNGEIEVLLTHPASGGYGLNLQYGGHIAVWYGCPWNLEWYQQFNARLPRSGQEHPVIIHHLVIEGTEDERPLSVLQDKGDVQAELLNNLKLKMEKYAP